MTNADFDASEVLDTLVVKKIQRRTYSGGAWVIGTIGGHRFEALVFPDGSRAVRLQRERGMTREETFLIDQDDLVRRVVPRKGQPYEHRCPRAACEAVADAVRELPGVFALRDIHHKAEVP